MEQSPSKRGLQLLNNITLECVSLDKTHQKICATLCEIETNIANACKESMSLRESLASYRIATKELSETLKIWERFFDTFRLDNESEYDNCHSSSTMKERAFTALSKGPELLKSIADGFNKLDKSVHTIASLKFNSSIPTPMGDANFSKPLSTPKSSINPLQKRIFKSALKKYNLNSTGLENTSFVFSEGGKSPESVGTSFNGSPPVTFAFSKPGETPGALLGNSLKHAQNGESPVSSNSTDIPSTPGSLKDTTRRLTKMGVLGVSSPASVSSIQEPSWTFNKTPLVHTGGKRLFMDDLCLLNSGNHHGHNFMNYTANPDGSFSSFSYSPVSVRRGTSSDLISSLDLADTSHAKVEDSDEELDISEITLDLDIFPPIFQSGDGAKQLCFLFEIIKRENIKNGITGISVSTLLRHLESEESNNPTALPFDQDTCFLLLDLLVRKKYLKECKSDDGESVWKIQSPCKRPEE